MFGWKSMLVVNLAWLGIVQVLMVESKATHDLNKKLMDLTRVLAKHADLTHEEIQQFIYDHQFNDIVKGI